MEERKAKASLKAIICVIMVFLASALLFYVHRINDLPKPPPATQLVLQGEYSYGGGDWLPLTEETEFSALDGDLILRGSFDREIPQGQTIYVYLNHVAIRAEINGQEFVRSGSWGYNECSPCGAYWFQMVSPGLTQEDEITLSLRNLHNNGNVDAYTLLLKYMYSDSHKTVLDALRREERFWQISGRSMVLFSLPLLGMALAFVQLRHSSMRLKMLYFSLITFFMGGYIVLDSKSWALWNSSVALGTYGKMLCIVLALYVFHLFVGEKTLTGFRRSVEVLWCAETLCIASIFVLLIAGGLYVYETLMVWGILQLFINTILFGCSLYECFSGKMQNRKDSISCLLMLTAVLLDMLNLYLGWCPTGVFSKGAYVGLFVFQIVRGNIYLTRSLRSLMRTKRLEKDLKNANATIAVSQIRAHFIFNILNSISGMCKYDPAKADETIVLFSRYLRANINILNEDRLVLLSEAVAYLEDYIALERVRFGDKIRFEKEIDTEEFRLPSLLLQPVVENAIKHGILPKPDGGTITLRARKVGRAYLVSIEDDGVGFEPGKSDAQISVGLENVRVRLEHHVSGKMQIESAPGKGTKVTFFIPCEEAK